MTVIGIDAAHWQNALPVGQLADAGIRFAIIKATHGLGTNPDVEFTRSWRGLLTAGITRGAYHWFTDSDPGMQARHFVRIVEASGYRDDDLPLAVDFEEPKTKFRGNELLDRLRTCIATVEDLTGRPVFLYTGDWYWRDFAQDIDAPDLVERCLLWHAAYPRVTIADKRACAVAPPALIDPRLPLPWRKRGAKETLWQFDGDGGCVLPNGVDADFNRFRGSLEAFRALSQMKAIPRVSDGPITQPESPSGKSSQSMRAVQMSDLSADVLGHADAATPLRAEEAEHTPLHLRGDTEEEL